MSAAFEAVMSPNSRLIPDDISVIVSGRDRSVVADFITDNVIAIELEARHRRKGSQQHQALLQRADRLRALADAIAP